MSEKVVLIATTNPGIEDIAVEEVKSILHASIIDVRENRGRIIFSIPLDRIQLIDRIKSIHRIRILLAEVDLTGSKEDLARIRNYLRKLRLEKLISIYDKFAIRVERVGEHEYSSIDVAVEAGDEVIKYFKNLYGFRLKVDLDYPSKIIVIDVIEDRAYISLEISGELSWHRRGYRIYEHPASLKPTLAYAMIVLSGLRDGEVIADLMCGGGTIPIEATLVTESSRAYCMDINPKHVRGAILNALAASVFNRINFIVGDARRAHELFEKDSIDVVISNPPYGIRYGSPLKVRDLYTKFLESLSRVSPRRIVLITTEHNHVKSVASNIGYRIVHERRVAHGGLWPHIIVLE